MIAFGPVPSRRLGRSLGINNIPPKTCSYACVYCQLGRTTVMQVERQAFYAPEQIAASVREQVARVTQHGEAIDYLTFVPDGEPTLDVHLGESIRLLKPLGIPIAVITNASLISRQDVIEDLLLADWVSLKVDAVDREIWRHIDRPRGNLRLGALLDGMLAFGARYEGELVTETMLVAGVNDGTEHLRQVADFLARLRPAQAYLSVPTRPPAEPWVHPPAASTLNAAYQILREAVPHVEYLIGYEGNAFSSTGDLEADLLNITAVHPMREDAVRELISQAGETWGTVDSLVARGQLVEARYGGHRFYLRHFNRPSAHPTNSAT